LSKATVIAVIATLRKYSGEAVGYYSTI